MKELLIALAIMHAGDSVTTVRNLHAGLREGNPLLPQNPTANVLVSGAETALEIYALHQFGKTSPTAARTLTIGLVGMNGVFIGFNLRAHQDARPKSLEPGR